MPEFEDPEPTITISQREYDSLKKDQNWLLCLEDAGVDNWSGIDYAYEMQNELNERGIE